MSVKKALTVVMPMPHVPTPLEVTDVRVLMASLATAVNVWVWDQQNKFLTSHLQHRLFLIPKTIWNRKEIVHEDPRGDKQLRKPADHKAQVNQSGGQNTNALLILCFAINRFFQLVFITSRNLTRNFFFYLQ